MEKNEIKKHQKGRLDSDERREVDVAEMKADKNPEEKVYFL
jgi:hypothetical protein